ncbi:11400_t:CDS:1 [Diversispora eburnea]|uniref:11400_t:CDS:1 n=1 Tax=Diversispora eburnea TaxID=1213867 RepID=A0A9N8ZFP8_9GLOM|nr:11400_t:CDS:1 [Diversispora eburnea]
MNGINLSGSERENGNDTEESEEGEEMIVLGGYNPCTWKNSNKLNNNSNFLDSFIFSFNLRGEGGGEDLRKEAKLSRIKIKEEAIYCSTLNGPCFGRGDLWMTGKFGSSKRTSYEFSIIDQVNFFAEDYEVFQIKNI